jgi:hypothetical protein
MRAARKAWILGDADLRHGRVLEIGPLANPVVDPSVADVRYVDVVDRAGLIAHYDGNPAVTPDAIPDIDFWLTREDGSVSTLAEAVAADAPFHHVVASHVIEHVPDMIGWLDDVAEVLVDDGALVLAIPDRRFCFDARRSPATVGQVVQAHLDRDRTPSARAVLDHFLDSVDFRGEDAWAGRNPPLAGTHTVEQVRQHFARQQAGEYVDCHVWPTTPVGFAELLADLLALDLADFAVERITATRVGHQEFYATLRRLPRQGDPTELRKSARDALAELMAGLPDESTYWPHPEREDELLRRQSELEQELAATRERLDHARAMRDRARAQRDEARARAERPADGVRPETAQPLRRLVRRLRRG